MDKYNSLTTYLLDLQFFAAEDEGRTELPTEFKKRKAREEEGQVLKSQDIVSFIVTFGTLLVLIFFIKPISRNIADLFRFFFQQNFDLSQGNLGNVFSFAGKKLFQIMLPIFGSAIALALIANYAQVGFLLVPKLLKPNLKRIAPNFSKYFKGIFGTRGLVNFIKSLVTVLGSLGVFLTVMNSSIFKILQSSQKNVNQTIDYFYSTLKDMLLKIAIMILLIAILDYFFQRREYLETLKMSKYEVRQEIYEQEGRPEIRQARQKRRNEIMKKKSLENVKTADVVITNPTHLAVALKYELGIDDAPVVVAKGQDLMAQKIKEIAKENDVFIYENKPLARELYKRLDIGDTIPADLYEAVSLVLSSVYNQQKEKYGHAFF